MAKIELTPPDTVPLIEEKQVGGAVKIKPEVVQSLNLQVGCLKSPKWKCPVHSAHIIFHKQG